jgi:hypothetical protein
MRLATGQIAGIELSCHAGFQIAHPTVRFDPETSELVLRFRVKTVESNPPAAPAPAAEAAPTAEATPVPVHAKRTKRQPIIVRERKRVFELSVTPINEGDAIIQVENDIEGADPDAVFVPAADIPALIRALTDVMAR